MEKKKICDKINLLTLGINKKWTNYGIIILYIE